MYYYISMAVFSNFLYHRYVKTPLMELVQVCRENILVLFKDVGSIVPFSPPVMLTILVVAVVALIYLKMN